MTVYELKIEHEVANSKLFTECGLFFAFSKEQFNDNKTPLKVGEKYVSLLGGGYCPKSNIDKLLNGMEENRKAYEAKIKANNLRVREIAYELGNHECYYTGDWSQVADMFPEIKPEVIHRIYLMESKKEYQHG